MPGATVSSSDAKEWSERDTAAKDQQIRRKPVTQADQRTRREKAGARRSRGAANRPEVRIKRAGRSTSERAQIGQRVLVGLSTGTPDTRGAVDVSTEEGGKMWSIVELGD